MAAIATPAGRGGIGVVRIAGPHAQAIAKAVLGTVPEARHATLGGFLAADGAVIDRGLALFFPAPHSYTGDDVLELQGHGGPVVMQMLLRRCVDLGARIAHPGEFTQRAFLNERIDLAQAESVADLIDASSAEAARSAARSLDGEFSRRVNALVGAVVDLRMHVEACIDFPEEEIDPEDIEAQRRKLAAARAQWKALLAEARQGAVLREGLTVVLIGRPNVGKSSLLNRLAGEDLAIVTPIAGTTRDHVRATISLEGVPIHLIDTAGLREGGDEVERIGIARTWSAVEKAGAAIFITDASDAPHSDEDAIVARLPADMPLVRARNKIDLAGGVSGSAPIGRGIGLSLSAKTGAGVDLLRDWLLQTAGWQPHGEGLFMARERHLVELEAAGRYLAEAGNESQVFELFAENLRLAQQALGRITGEVTADDLLGEIFSRFCIGK
nr:tRNA uridine-5-carboxymethylaminomethyl(34) synthesis GTPase MnmE [Usitatibacter palustris]